MAMGLPYWIEEFNSTFIIWTKVDLPANSTTTIYIVKQTGFTPNPENVFLFFDDFYDLSKWDTTLALGSYDVDSSTLRMWDDWGGCCDGHCYYHGLATHDGFTRPFTVDLVFWQDPHTPSSNCGKTGPSVEHYNEMEVITSTATNGSGLNIRIGSNYYNFDEPFPAGTNRLTIKFGIDTVECQGSWLSAPVSATDHVTNTKNPILIAGDTDSNSIIDYVDYLIVRQYGPDPSVTVTQQSPNIWKVDIQNSTSTDYTNFQVAIPGDGIVSSVTESLNIATAIAKVLFGRGNGLYKWDGSTWVYVAAKDSIDETTFDNNGMLVPLTIDKATINLLTPTPEIVAHIISDNPVTNATCLVDFKPYPELIVPTSLKDITGLQSLTVNVQTSGINGVVKLAVTHDLLHYYAWDGSTWVQLTDSGLDHTNQSDVDNVINNGMDINTVNTLTATEWQILYNDKSQIAFAIAIQYNVIEDIKKLDNIVLNIITPEDTWEDVTGNSTIWQLRDAIIITVNETGLYKVNYTD